MKSAAPVAHLDQHQPRIARRRYRRPMQRFLAVLTAAVLLALPAAAQNGEDQFLRRSYTFGTPDDPALTWRLAVGGRLYDNWWAVLGGAPPDSTHRRYPAAGPLDGGPETWRCVSCHGWDYRGVAGVPGLRSFDGRDADAVARIVRDRTHRYTPAMIPDDALRNLALFITAGQHDTTAFVDPATSAVAGDPVRGRQIYQNVCAICHNFLGDAEITGEAPDLRTLGAVAARNPAQALHKVRNGQPSADMLALRAFDMQAALDVIAYAQSLPQK